MPTAATPTTMPGPVISLRPNTALFEQAALLQFAPPLVLCVAGLVSALLMTATAITAVVEVRTRRSFQDVEVHQGTFLPEASSAFYGTHSPHDQVELIAIRPMLHDGTAVVLPAVDVRQLAPLHPGIVEEAQRQLAIRAASLDEARKRALISEAAE